MARVLLHLGYITESFTFYQFHPSPRLLKSHPDSVFGPNRRQPLAMSYSTTCTVITANREQYFIDLTIFPETYRGKIVRGTNFPWNLGPSDRNFSQTHFFHNRHVHDYNMRVRFQSLFPFHNLWFYRLCGCHHR